MYRLRKIFVNESSIVGKWTGLNVPVFFDFGQPILWLLVPIISDETIAYVLPIKKEDFLETFRDEDLGKVNSFWKWMQDYIIYIKNPRPQPQTAHLTLPRRRYSRRGPLIDCIVNSRRTVKRRR